ncbi:hypothetical protein [Prescottella agglutinans]|uniref:Uncharacterized protein n=1 Tax=Prescottella agglutinans TaxID=1644129 RepID=A0ABT6MHD0_9NOCA|nr:hypothetical protein [Prescottella agglutinans]MDH6283712.1 hypothetical protein [Prescottella agglutinans]
MSLRKKLAGGVAVAMAAGIAATAPTAGANPPPSSVGSSDWTSSGGSSSTGSLAAGAVAAAFDAGLPVVEEFGTQKPPWYSAPTVFYRIVDDRAALSSPSTKFVVLGQRPPDTFAVAPGPFGMPGLAGPIATWDPRGVDPNVRWSFVATACAGDCAGAAFFSYAG